MHTFHSGPRKPEESDRNKYRTGNSGGEAELGLGDAVVVCNEPAVVSCPEWVRKDSTHHADEEPEESAPDHLKVEMVNVREDEGKGLKEDVQYAKKNRGEGAEEGDHRFEDEEFERAFAGVDDGMSDGTVEFLDRCAIPRVAGGLAERDSTLAE